MSAKAREEATKLGELPHAFLARVARGEEIDGHLPTFNERMDAAKAAAPYFAPRLSTTDISAFVRTADRPVRSLTEAELMEIAAGGA